MCFRFILRINSDNQTCNRFFCQVRKHWEDVALDLGYDPKQNIKVEEGDKMYNVSIREDLDETMRQESGDWW